MPFIWSPACKAAFEELKKRLVEAPVLVFPNFGRGFVLETDASGLGLGAVLAQEQEDGTTRPIAYASRTLQQHEKNYGSTELEGLGVVWAVKHFHPYLYGHHCDVYTDHQALKALLNTPQPSGKLARWGIALQELELSIHYRPGKSNANADSLSRTPIESDTSPEDVKVVVATLNADVQLPKDGDQPLGDRQRADPALSEIIAYLERGDLPEDSKRSKELVSGEADYEVIDGILYRVDAKKTLKIVPPTGDRRKIFDEAHGGVFGGHLREAKIHRQLAKHYWWPRMRSDVSAWCRACVTCASRHVRQAVRPPLTPIPVAGPFDRVGVDILKLPTSYDGNQYAVVFVDYLTKWPEVFATRDQSSITVAQLFVEQIKSRHGVPSELLSDRGMTFLQS